MERGSWRVLRRMREGLEDEEKEEGSGEGGRSVWRSEEYLEMEEGKFGEVKREEGLKNGRSGFTVGRRESLEKEGEEGLEIEVEEGLEGEEEGV